MKRVTCILIYLVLAMKLCVAEERCNRIVSLAPSITEVLFELQLGDRIVGLTRYCRYPPAALEIEKIGGFYDLSLEKIVSLKPTDVFGLRENGDIIAATNRLGFSSLASDHSSLSGIKASITAIAERCGVAARAEEKLRMLAERERALATTGPIGKPQRTLVVVGRMFEGESLSGLYISGKDGFYSDLLKIVGLENINNESTISIPMLSPEGLMTLKPEVIIEVVNRDDPRKEDLAALWDRYGKLPAVKNNRVLILSDDFASIPGPRYIVLAEQIAHLLKDARARHG